MAQQHDKIIAELETLAHWMDSKFAIPGTKMRMGLDGLFGFIPGIGDTMGFMVSAYMLGRAMRLGVPKRLMVRMIWNIFVDWLVGLVPIVGDFFDIKFKANLKNVRLLKEHVAKHHHK